jgi:dipeptidyl aminopeptidase/acylaminoacyl peptidase
MAVTNDVARATTHTAHVPVSIHGMFEMRLPGEPQISPDGQLVAFTVSGWLVDQPRAHTRIWVVPTAGGEARPFSNGQRGDSEPHWSPDGQQLAFLSRREDDGDKTQVYVMPREGGTARRICKMPNGVADLAWSPDGTRLAFVSEDEPPPGSDPIVVGPERHRRLWIVRVDDGVPVPVTPADVTVWHHVWSPDGRRFALYVADVPGETGWYTGQLGIVAADGGAVRQIGQLSGQADALAWSPDSHTLAYIAGDWSDRGLVGGDLWAVDVDGGQHRNLTPGTELSISFVAWSPDGRSLLGVARDRVWDLVFTLDAAGGEPHPLARETVLGTSWWPKIHLASDGRRFVALRQDLTTPPEIWHGEVRPADAREALTWRRLTRLNPLPEETWHLSPTEVISYAGADGWRIDALLTLPAEATRGAPPPLILLAHGGPSGTNRAQWGGGWTWPQQWAAAGFAVLQPNFRGSLGRGTAFADAILGDMGGKDLQDLLLGVDHLARTGQIDAARVGIMGWSYGGFTTAWAVTQTERFKAAVMGAGICDFHSFHAQSNIPDWDERFLRARPAEQPDVYRERSAITHIAHARTPTLIVHGEKDLCVPVNQAYAFHRGLREQGIASELVVYPREGHGFLERDHLRDLSERMLAWFQRYL